MNNHPVASGAASGGVATALVVILAWALGFAHVTVPGEVAAAAVALISPALHIAALKLGVSEDIDATAPQSPVEAPVAVPATHPPAMDMSRLSGPEKANA